MSYSDYYELRKIQLDEYEESLRMDQEKEKKAFEEEEALRMDQEKEKKALEKAIEDEDEDEPELTIDELRLARLKALDKNYVEEKPKVKVKRKTVKVIKPSKKSTK
jgi:hypothetical protein